VVPGSVYFAEFSTPPTLNLPREHQIGFGGPILPPHYA